MLRLFKAIPGMLTSMSFDAAGSSATGVINIYTDASIGAAPEYFCYSGSWAGPAYDNDNTYLISWSGATNTIDLTQEATSPANVNQGSNLQYGTLWFHSISTRCFTLTPTSPRSNSRSPVQAAAQM